MDTYTEAVTSRRRYLPVETKWRIVEETLAEGASVAQIARAHGVSANLIFHWRRLYKKGMLCSRGTAKLLPVSVARERSPALAGSWDGAGSESAGAIHIQLRGAQLRVEGRVDEGLLRVVLECLGR